MHGRLTITLGPLLFNWAPERWREFYARIADEAPVDVVCLGEVVCSKRTPFVHDVMAEVVDRLERAGVCVVFSTLAMPTLARERRHLKELVGATDRLIEAFARLPAALRGAFRLLVVGIQDDALARFRADADRLGIGDRASINGFAAEGDIAALLSGAAVLCFPSRSEGFGLPILDAFLCGTPVLTANRTSLPEVVGDAGVLVDPDSTEAIADGLARMLESETLRAELSARGFARLAGYTWDRVARQTAEVFERAAR